MRGKQLVAKLSPDQLDRILKFSEKHGTHFTTYQVGLLNKYYPGLSMQDWDDIFFYLSSDEFQELRNFL